MKVERVRVGDVLRLERRSVQIDPVAEYTLIGVYSFGKGIFHRDPRPGSDIGDYRFFEVSAGDLVLSNIQAWEGAIGCASERDLGAIGTRRFLTYVPSDDRIDTSWARYFFLSEAGFPLIQRAAPGSVMRNRTLAIDRFEALVIPLPPVAEQRQIAASLSSILEGLNRLSVPAGRALEQSSALRWSSLRREFDQLTTEFGTSRLEEVVKLNPESVRPEDEFGGAEFVYIDIGSVANETGEIREPQRLPAISAPSRARRRVREGDVIISTVRPNLRGVALVPGTLDGAVCSTGFAVLRPSPGLDPEFLLLQVMSGTFIDQLVAGVRGGHYPAVNDRTLRTTQLTVPSPARQLATIDRVRGFDQKVTALRMRLAARADHLPVVERSVLNHAFAALR